MSDLAASMDSDPAIETLRKTLLADPALVLKAKTSNLPGYRHSFDPKFVDALVELRGEHHGFFRRAVGDPEYRRSIVDSLRPEVYQHQRG